MIDRFEGEFRFLSNFYPAPVMMDGVEYPTVEHAYQAAKTTDVVQREEIRKAERPGIAKRAGRKVTIRGNWDEIKLPVMEQLVRQKFRIPELRNKLLATGEGELAEGNHWGDTFWGVCNGIGDNHLGKILMKVREELRGQNDNV